MREDSNIAPLYHQINRVEMLRGRALKLIAYSLSMTIIFLKMFLCRKAAMKADN